MVKIYTRAGCAPCVTLKYYLSRKNIPYEELSSEGTDVSIYPTILIGAERIEGLNFARLNELLVPASGI